MEQGIKVNIEDQRSRYCGPRCWRGLTPHCHCVCKGLFHGSGRRNMQSMTPEYIHAQISGLYPDKRVKTRLNVGQMVLF